MSILVIINLPFKTFASNNMPIFRLINQVSILWTVGWNVAGKSVNCITCALFSSSHHWRLLWYSVGNSRKRGWYSFRKIPVVCGGRILNQEVFQNTGVKYCLTSLPYCIFPAAVISTFPPSCNTANALASKVSVVYTVPCTSSTCAGYTQKSQSFTASQPSIRTSRFSFCGVSIPSRVISTLPRE